MRQLDRWLQVPLFTQQSAQECLPLLELAVHRGRLTELMAVSIAISPELAYATGMLSLADCALGISMDEIIKSLNMVDEAHQALLRSEGPSAGCCMSAKNWKTANSKTWPG